MHIDLQKHCILACVQVPSPPRTRKEKQVSEETLRNHGAARGMGAFFKALFPKEALGGLSKAGSKVRDAHNSNSLPWPVGRGVRLVPLRLLDRYRAEVRRAIQAYDEQVELFTSQEVWEAWIDDAKRRLGDLFNPHDYPSPEELRARLKVDLRLSTVPSHNDVQAILGDVVGAEITRQVAVSIEDTAAVALEESVKALVEDALTRVRSLDNYLSGEAKRFYQSNLDVIDRVVAMLESLPVPPDHPLKQTCTRVHGLLTGVREKMPNVEAVKSLRGVSGAETKAVADANALLEQIDAELGM